MGVAVLFLRRREGGAAIRVPLYAMRSIQYAIATTRHAVFKDLVLGIVFLAGAGGTAKDGAAAAHGHRAAAAAEDSADGSADDGTTHRTFSGGTGFAGIFGQGVTFHQVPVIGDRINAFGINYHALLWCGLAGR